MLHDEAPAHHDLLSATLSRSTMNFMVGEEAFAVQVDGSNLRVGDPLATADVTIHTSLSTLLALFDARRTVGDAIERGELDVRGTPDSLDTAADALSILLHGLVRAPSGANLLDELRSMVIR